MTVTLRTAAVGQSRHTGVSVHPVLRRLHEDMAKICNLFSHRNRNETLLEPSAQRQAHTRAVHACARRQADSSYTSTSIPILHWCLSIYGP